MLCRLCLIDNNNFQKLEGGICDMLKAVLRKTCIRINSPVICSNCIFKLEKAFDFKSTCLRTQKILSLYGGSNQKIVYLKDNKLCVSSNNDTALKLCRTCLRHIENGFYSNLLRKFDSLDKLSMYMPEMVISDKQSSLICYECSEHFRIFSELINTSNETESMISIYCNENCIIDTEQIDLNDLTSKKTNENTSISKLLEGNNHFLLNLENEFESTYLSDSIEDSKRRIIRKIIEEDVDLFYKEKPDFDLNDSFAEEIDSNHGNIIFGPQPRQLLLSDSEEDLHQKRIRQSIEEDEQSVRLSFETEESSLSPGTLSDRHFYDCESQDEEKKDEREATSPNPFIFFNNDSQNDDRCSCDEGFEVGQLQTKRKSCEKCKWKKASGYNSETTDGDSNGDVAVKRPKKDGKKKCRKAYGIEFKDLWCTQCRWKKACTRFGNTKAVSRR